VTLAVTDPGWTVSQLEVHLTALLREMDRRIEGRFVGMEQSIKVAFDSAALAVEKAERDNKGWREASNEWRATMNDRERTFLPRLEAEKQFAEISNQLAELKALASSTQGRQLGVGVMWGILVGGGGIAIAIVTLILNG